MRYAKIMENDTVDVKSGIAVSVWFQGCPFHCKGCHNPETWNFNGGIEIDEKELINKVLVALDKNGIKRDLSILGGEPLCDENVGYVYNLIKAVRAVKPEIMIYIWTGNTYDELKEKTGKYQEILSETDVLITGRYIDELRDITLPLRGSTNQEVRYKVNFN